MIYLDHHAATPLSPAVREAVARAHEVAWANPSSIHGAGRAARQLLESARRDVAKALDAHAADLVLTGGATEACNLALRGIAGARVGIRRIITTAIEHPAIAKTCAEMNREGYVVEFLPVGASAAQLRALLEQPALVALQWVNHETGMRLPLEAYAATCAERGAPLIVDACQALGKVPLSLRKLAVSAFVVSAAKIGGPAGAAAVWFERCLEVSPVIHGGSQERGRRPGTPDVASLAGFGAACRAVPARLAEMPRLAVLRDRLEAACVELGGRVNGFGPRVDTVTNVSFPHWRGDMLVPALDLEGLCASAGAACATGVEPSPVLLALYPDEPQRASSALRLSLGPETSEDEVERAIAILRRVLPRGRT